ncbi:DUF1499 domain-containing protein [Sediminicoccus sp. KRV36]|uniref:DUF1499 domain-containing protein n=1 Tax=Sediminicoccus sp. KRV36 TaxID=3133721 RepID=UPI0020102980|nr:DUF1499 domain-containing protein [Sediminicoccus rosea]UPY38814.1 DUF1499 domain-containing protein [Sediminicoccus rosea]
MTSIAALIGRGPKGLGTPAPIEFASLVQPSSPNTCLAAPAGHPGPKQVTAPILPGSPEEVFTALLRVAEGFPRTWRIAAWPERRQAQWVERSALVNYPDIITAECVATPAGTSLFLYSRSLFGYSDLGVNGKRVARWLAALAAALPAAALPVVASPVAAAPLSPLAAQVQDAAPGQHVLLAWDDPLEMPEIALRAIAAGAASVQAMTPERPEQADQRLAEAGIRLGLSTEAEALLAARPAARDPLPPPLHADPGAWRAWWMRGSLDAPDLRERLPQTDLVVDGADLARLDGDPPRRLAGLRATGARRLILRSSLVPMTSALSALGLGPWHAGELTAESSAALDAALQSVGISLPQFAAFPERLTREAALAAGLADPWWWFISEAGLDRWLAEAGWRVEGRRMLGASVVVTAAC